jgi:hypothetical protein
MVMPKRQQVRTEKPRRKKPSQSKVVENAVRRVMEEVEDELPDKMEVWLGMFELFVGLTVKEDQTLTVENVRTAGELADEGLQLLEHRWPTVIG